MSLLKRLNLVIAALTITFSLIIGLLAILYTNTSEQLSRDRLKSELDLVANSQIPYLIEDFKSNNVQITKLRTMALTAAFSEIELAVEIYNKHGELWFSYPQDVLQSYKLNKISKATYTKQDIFLSPDLFGYIHLWANTQSVYLEKKNWAYVFFFLLIFTFTCILIFRYFLNTHILKPILELSKYVSAYEGNTIFDPKISSSPELSLLVKFIRDLVDRLKITNDEKSYAEASARIAKQVAHDIRSPLSALDIVINTASSLPSEHKDIAIQAVRRINYIANDLLKKKSLGKIVLSLNELAEILLTLKKEKELNPNVRIRLNLCQDLADKNIYAESQQFYRILSNLINNSIEAKKEDLINIKISLDYNKEHAILHLADNGCGIPKNILFELQKNSLPHSNKADGHGLGLSSARATLDQWNAKFKIDSLIGKGTTVTLYFKKYN